MIITNFTRHERKFQPYIFTKQFNFLNSRFITTDLRNIKVPKINIHFHIVTNSSYVNKVGDIFIKIIKVIEAMPKNEIIYFQVRFERHELHEHLQLCERLVREMYILNPNVKLIINDDPALAVSIGADGVHVGKHDLPPLYAKKVMTVNGDDNTKNIVGFTPSDTTVLMDYNFSPHVNYFGIQIGASGTTHRDPDRIWTEEELQAIIDTSTKPIHIIGGITRKNLPRLIRFLRDGDAFAICGDIMKSEVKEIGGVVREILTIRDAYVEELFQKANRE